MSKKTIMQNPALNPLVMELENPIWSLHQIWTQDLEANKTSYRPTDSTVKSALRRTMGHLKGRPPKPLSVTKEKEQWTHNVTQNLWRVCQEHLKKSTPKRDLLICLKAIEDSIKVHSVGNPQGYLTFLDGFFADMGATVEEVDEETFEQQKVAF